MNKYKIIIFIAIFMLIFAFKANCDGVVTLASSLVIFRFAM